MTKKITLNLEGLDGNAIALVSAFRTQAKREGWKRKEIKAVTKDAMSGDYDHLLQTLNKHTH